MRSTLDLSKDASFARSCLFIYSPVSLLDAASSCVPLHPLFHHCEESGTSFRPAQGAFSKAWVSNWGKPDGSRDASSLRAASAIPGRQLHGGPGAELWRYAGLHARAHPEARRLKGAEPSISGVPESSPSVVNFALLCEPTPSVDSEWERGPACSSNGRSQGPQNPHQKDQPLCYGHCKGFPLHEAMFGGKREMIFGSEQLVHW